MENYQLKDGGIEVPEVLHPYMKGLRTIGPQEKRLWHVT
jgi:seryl-tRNA synthetase